MVRTELVGRERELAVLDQCLGAALTGQPRIVLCRGEPGIGKTRLAEEVAARAKAQGVPTTWGRAVDAEGAPPYWPWRQLLRTTADVVDVAALADEHHLTIDVSRLAPDVFPAPAPAVDAASGEDRFRQFDAVGRLLRHVSAQTPLVVVLEDVHWADEPSLLLLQHVARTLTDERLLFVVNCRPTTASHSAILTDLVREPVTREVCPSSWPPSTSSSTRSERDRPPLSSWTPRGSGPTWRGIPTSTRSSARDFFVDPLPTADAYILMEVIHDWPDAEAAAILTAIRRAASPGARVLIVENVLEDARPDQRGHTLDVIMLAVTGGRERTGSQLRRLLEGAGFANTTVIDTAGPLRIVEATTA